jgi:hypothetical protein
MPKRTNAFQNLFHLIYSQRAEGAIVTESKMLLDKVTGKLREVDLVIQSTVAGHAVTIGVECNAKMRNGTDMQFNVSCFLAIAFRKQR